MYYLGAKPPACVKRQKTGPQFLPPAAGWEVPGPASLSLPGGRFGSGWSRGHCPRRNERPSAAALAVTRRLSRRGSAGAAAGLAVHSPTWSCGGRKTSNKCKNIFRNLFYLIFPIQPAVLHTRTLYTVSVARTRVSPLRNASPLLPRLGGVNPYRHNRSCCDGKVEQLYTVALAEAGTG